MIAQSEINVQVELAANKTDNCTVKEDISIVQGRFSTN